MENPITDLKKEHIPALRKFIEKQFHEKYILLNQDFFDWQYKSPLKDDGVDYTMKIAFHDGKVFGYCGYIPAEFNINGQTVKGRCLANLMVDEKSRGFGLGFRLLQSVISDMPFSYVNGYNPSTEGIYNKHTGWGSMDSTLKRWIGVINKEKVERLSGEKYHNTVSFESFGPVKEEKINFGESFDVFWEKVVGGGQFSCTQNRNRKYLNWRYASHPVFKNETGYRLFISRQENNEINGYLISRIEGAGGSNSYKIARIIDLVTINPDKNAKELVSCFVNHAKENNCDLVDFLASTNPFQQESFNKLGFIEKTESQIPILFNPVANKKSIYWTAYAGQRFYHDPSFFTGAYITKGDGDQDRPNIV